MIAFPGRLGFFDHPRLAADLMSLAGPVAAARRRGRMLEPPQALLERCGADMLFADPADRGARALQADLGLEAWLEAQEFGRAMAGNVRLSWLAAATALGRRDLRPRFRRAGRLDLDAMLRWLVLHGIVEHGLYALAGTAFQRDLLRPGRVDRLAPLARLLLAERPDLAPRVAPGEAGMPAGLRRWLAGGGADEYRLAWCLPASWMGPGPALPDGWTPPAAPPPPPASPAPGFADRACRVPLTGEGPPPCISERALGRAPDGAAAVYATDLALRLPRPPDRSATLIVQALPEPAAPPGETVLVALDGARVLGTARIDPRSGGPAALVLRDLPPGRELLLRLSLAAPERREADAPWARWRALWLLAA